MNEIDRIAQIVAMKKEIERSAEREGNAIMGHKVLAAKNLKQYHKKYYGTRKARVG